MAHTKKEGMTRGHAFLFGGDTQTRTGGGAFAELCLTTWLCRPMDNRTKALAPVIICMEQVTRLELATSTLARWRSTRRATPACLEPCYAALHAFRRSPGGYPAVSTGEWCLRPESNQRHADVQSPAP